MTVVCRITPLVSAVALLAAVVAVPPGVAAQPVGQLVGQRAGQPTSAQVIERRDADPQVLVVSVDALNPQAMRKLGHRRAPNLWRLVDEGASTLRARTQVELTDTLPNHASMMTGRNIAASSGGHGVTWNDDRPERPPTVQSAAGHEVDSLFEVAHAAGISTALFAAKSKFSLFRRSWRDGLDRVTIKDGRDAAVVRAARRDLLRRDRGVTFVHLSQADRAGHDDGFMGSAYLRAVRRVDALLGTVLHAADTRPALADLTIVLTADHGGQPRRTSHSKADEPGNYRIPFAAWGPGTSTADLYDLNPGYRDPHRRRPGLTGRQPVRNGDVANVVLGLLGLDPVPGSRFGVRWPLRLR